MGFAPLATGRVEDHLGIMTDFLRHAPRLHLEHAEAVPIHVVPADSALDALGLSAPALAWAEAQGFNGGLGQLVTLPDADGRIAAVLLGYGTAEARTRARFPLAKAASALPKGVYQLAADAPCDGAEFALGWIMDQYRFDRYRVQPQAAAELVVPNGVDADAIHRLADSEFLARDLINTPAEDMGPDELEAVVSQLAELHGASFATIRGDALLELNFPLIHMVGRASHRAPRLLDLTWGEGPLLTLVGKGVCYDTGGLNLKPGGSMALMKKDMGGAANVLALAHAIMSAGWPVRLRVLIPAVENAVAGNSYRPGDVLQSRKGLTVENNNTDAEGRLVLADALALASEENPAQIVSMATLTGAARVALGPDLPPFYTDDDAFAARLSQSGNAQSDPIWRMPFYDPYEPELEPGIADLNNAPFKGFAGSITAALFLRRFADGQAYSHFDIYGWTPAAKPARTKGGAGQGWRALFDALPKQLGL